ncbi:MAG: hypothetical protein ACI86X_001782 [Moritella sp.]|jgi:uncharacterized protein YaaW (UPF0174 family)
MQLLLQKCEYSDLAYISKTLDSYFSLTDDRKRKKLLLQYQLQKSDQAELIALLDKQIRYYGSSDIAYAARQIFSHKGGVSVSELIDDVCKKCNVTVKKGGSTALKLERLVKAVVERDLFSKTPEELAIAFEAIGVGKADKQQIINAFTQNGKVAVLPIIVEVLGPQIALCIIESIIISMMSQVIGKEAAKQLLKELVKKNPWMNALGPIIWGISGAWIALDLQGPAFRKTVPILLYLGVVAMRENGA